MDQMLYSVEVQKGRSWSHRVLVPATSPNAALRAYGIGGRPRLGNVTSKSGKRFRALNTGTTVTA